MIEQIEEEVCGPVEVKKCIKVWLCQNEDCSIKIWGDSDDCDTYTITECKHILRNYTVTKNVPNVKMTTIDFCESVPKTKCEIKQVKKCGPTADLPIGSNDLEEEILDVRQT